MKSTKSAVLFYGKNKVPTPFDEYKQYDDIGTGYVALYEQNDNACILCRILDDYERPLYSSNSHKLVLKGDDYNDLKEVTVIILNSQLKSIEEADLLIGNYSKVI